MQTPGGAVFEKDCVCTTIDVFQVKGATNGDATAVNSCRKLAPSGEFLNATGWLSFRPGTSYTDAQISTQSSNKTQVFERKPFILVTVALTLTRLDPN